MPICPDCGMQIELGARNCLHCGHSIVVFKRRLRWKAICLGAFVGFALNVTAGLIIHFVVKPHMSEPASTLINVGIAAMSYIIVGLITGAMARYRGRTHGIFSALIVSVLAMISNLIILRRPFPVSTYGVSVTIVGMILTILLIVALGASGGAWGERLRNRRSRPDVHSQL
jgi:hypothetical protein